MLTKEMTTALTPVDHEGEPRVDARALYSALGVKARFNDWISRRIEEYGFTDPEDFYSILSKTGGRPRHDYLVTVDMAKELAMLERNAQYAGTLSRWSSRRSRWPPIFGTTGRRELVERTGNK